MRLRSLSIGSRKRDLKYWRVQLARARQELWERRLNKAEKLFSRIGSDLDRQIAGDTRDELISTRAEAGLGTWATQYFRDSTQRALYRDAIAQIEPDTRIWFFIAKVFFQQRDTSQDALAAYLYLLQQKPSQKIARQFLALLSQAEVSETSLALLEQIVAILTEDIETATLLCKWHLKAHNLNRATEIARQILDRDPDCLDAHRCIAYTAECSENWEAAKSHYRFSQDWLRLAVVCNKSQDIQGATEALGSVPESQRDSPTWLYYAGWNSYKQGDIELALRQWQRLQTMYPASAPVIGDTVNAVLEQTLYEYLQNYDLLQGLPPAIQNSTVYAVEAHLRLGAVELLIRRNPQAADPHLRYAVVHQPENLVPVTYLALCKAIKHQDASLDKAFYQQLLRRYGDASLFTWLRGLWLLQDDPIVAQRYLAKAHQDGIGTRHLPPEAVSATAWLVSRLTNQPSLGSLNGVGQAFAISNLPHPETDIAPFCWAVASSYGMEALQNQSDQDYLFTAEYYSPVTSPTSWTSIQAIYYAQRKEWLLALNALAGDQHKELEQEIVSQAIGDKLSERDWTTAAELVSRGLGLEPRSRKLKNLARELQGPIRQQLWHDQAFETLETRLQEQLNSRAVDTQVHHNLALVYTKMAIERDAEAYAEHKAPNGIDYWARAIGHWAVVLSDDEYWEHWRKQRGQIYGFEIELQQIRELEQRSIPRLIQRYHASKETGPLQNRHCYYGAIIDHEIELAAAMRYVVHAAEQQQVKLPAPVRRLLSPLLLKEYGKEAAGRKVVKALVNLKLSHYEAQLIRQAFSPMSDIKALVEAEQYQMALDKLRVLGQKKRRDKAQRNEIRREMARTLELYARELVNSERWGDAISVAREGFDLQPLNTELEQLLVDALVGWANQKIQEEAYEDAVQELEHTRSDLQNQHAELSITLGEVLARWGIEAHEDDDTETALKRYEKALVLDSSNLRARNGAARIYHNRALVKVQNEQLEEAAQDALRAMKYTEDPATANLLAMIYRDLAIKYSAQDNWHAALDHAQKAFEYGQTQEYLTFLVATNHDYAIYLAQSNQYGEAIKRLEAAINLPYDRSALNVEGLLSNLYTDLGAGLYNTGYVADAVSCWQKALEYNPGNDIARRNLSLAGGYYR